MSMGKQKQLVGGIGITGRALMDFFVQRQIPCVGFEELSEQNFTEAQRAYAGREVELFYRELPAALLEQIAAIWISPGVPLTRPWIQEATQREIPIRGELELASQYLPASKIIGVTGTNGKSTTVSLIQEMLVMGGMKSALKGNIGTPLITAVTEPPQDYYVVEISSYQLETIERFHAHTAVLMNITDDHLDRYQGLADYANAKGRLFMNQTPADLAVYNADDFQCRRLVREISAHTLPFSLTNRLEQGGYVDKDFIVIQYQGTEQRYLLAEASLKGLHHQENMLAAALVATALGVPDGAIRRTLMEFRSLPHRMTPVGRFQGMDFFDDSKATNVGAVVMSLASFRDNVVLIMGGRDKQGSYAPLKGLIEHKVKALIVLGESKPLIMSAFDGLCPLYPVDNMQAAVAQAYQVGKTGDTVLLAPACSSFDQYQNYAQRGDDFVHWVKELGK